MTLRAVDVAARLRVWPGLRFVTGAAASGKSTVSAALARRLGVPVLDIDERLYGSWHGRFDPERHPACYAWSSGTDPLAWQLAMTSGAFLDFHDASTLEALDLLAADLAAGGDPATDAVLLVDGGFGSVRALTAMADPSRIACIAPAPDLRAVAWTADPARREFLDAVAEVTAVPDPVGRFLALDAALAVRMEADAIAAGVPLVARRSGDSVDDTAARLGAALGLS